MSPRELAQLDQLRAARRERDAAIDRAIVRGCWAFLIVVGIATAYAVGALLGAWPAAPWSPLGQA